MRLPLCLFLCLMVVGGMDTKIENVRILGGHAHVDILIKQGTIYRIVPTGRSGFFLCRLTCAGTDDTAARTVIFGEGLAIIPGFVDLHPSILTEEAQKEKVSMFPQPPS